MFGKETVLSDSQLIKRLAENDEVDELECQVRLCKMLGLAVSKIIGHPNFPRESHSWMK